MTKVLSSIDELAAAPYNPRRISDGAAAGLSASLARFGDVAGIVWNQRSGQLVCGHQRVEQLRKLGAQLFTEDGRAVLRVGKSGERFAVRVVDWDEAQEKAANIAANNPRIAGEFTEELQQLLEEVQGSIGTELFEELALDQLLRASGDLTFPDDDPATEPPDDLAAVEIRCVRELVSVVTRLLDRISEDDRFKINIS